MPSESPLRGARRTWRRTICLIWPSCSGWKTTNSSTRFTNSGRKCACTCAMASPRHAAQAAPQDSRAFSRSQLCEEALEAATGCTGKHPERESSSRAAVGAFILEPVYSWYSLSSLFNRKICGASSAHVLRVVSYGVHGWSAWPSVSAPWDSHVWDPCLCCRRTCCMTRSRRRSASSAVIVSRMSTEPRLLVITTIVFLKLTVRPCTHGGHGS